MSEAAPSANSIDGLLGYAFRDRSLIETALSHPSYSHEIDGSRGNERLEFLGDAVLDLVISQILYDNHRGWSEGDLTRARAGMVNESALAAHARALDVGRFIKLGRTEQRSGGHDKDSVLANCFEALVAAIYLDGGLAPVVEFVHRRFGDELDRRPERDVKTRLQEWAHARFQETPIYTTVGDSGVQDDEERFEVEVRIGDERWGRGVGRSKRSAERAAAREALARATPGDG